MAFILREDFVKEAIDNLAEDQKCQDLHPGSCNRQALVQLAAGLKSTYKLYFIIHLIPLLIGYKKTLQKPQQSLLKFVQGYAKSMLFVAGTLFIIRRCICLYTKYIRYMSAVYTGFITGFPLMLESPGRRTQISLYCVTKGMQMLYLIVKRRYPWLSLPYGQGWLLSISAALVSFFYLDDPDLFRSAYKKVLNLFIKDI